MLATGYKNNRLKTYVIRAFCAALMTMYSQSVFALGIGAAETDSFIGEKLSVRIPLFNVASPNSLQLLLETPQFGGNDQSTVQIELDRSNFQLAINLISEQVINEPYLNFKLQIIDNNTKFEKEFAILLNLPGQGQNSVASSNSIVRNDVAQTSATTNIIDSRLIASNIVSNNSLGSLMGPYDTAIAGQIPNRFGAVLDGQSIWRVARRINEAMGVSQSQMIWALYQANPDAFFSNSIESLKAGVYLSIPSEAQVKSVSHLQAKENLQALRLSQSAPDTIIKPSLVQQDASQGNSELIDVAEKPEKSGEEVIDSPFQVTSIDKPGGDISAQSQSNAVIESLTETVGNMAQQLERKDKKIEFLEDQVEELKTFISSEDLVAPSADNASELINSIDDLSTNIVSNNELIPVEEPIESSKASSNQASVFSWLKNSWLWILLSVLLLILIAFLSRVRIFSLMQNLNIFNKRADVEFSVAEVEHESIVRIPSETSRESNKVKTEPNVDAQELKSVYTNGIDVEDRHHSFDEGSISVNTHMVEVEFAEEYSEGASIEFDSEYEKEDSILNLKPDPAEFEDPILAAIKAPSQNKVRYVKNDLPEGFLSKSKDDFSELEATINIIGSEISERLSEESQSFDSRLEELLTSREYDSARELLDFARNTEIDDQRYHFERLKVLEMMGDDTAFYKHYYSIEDFLTDFSSDIQAKISHLVIKVAKDN